MMDHVWPIAVITTAIVRGDLTQKIWIQVGDEMSTEQLIPLPHNP